MSTLADGVVSPARTRLAFGSYVLDPLRVELRQEGRVIPLRRKAFDLLLVLASQPERVLGKDELLAAVWPGVVVGDDSLAQCVHELRAALGTEGAAYVRTVLRRGYRFDAVVRSDPGLASPDEASTAGDPTLAEASGAAGAAASTATPQQLWPRGVESSELKEALQRPAIERTGRRRLWLGLGAVVVALAVWFAWQAFNRGLPYSAVAVLPFAADIPANAPLADGIAEETINALTRVVSLRVAPRASAFRFRGADPLEAGRRLDAAAVVTGSLEHNGERVTLQVDLIDVARAAQIWSRRYEVMPVELPNLQSRVIDDLARSLRVRQAAGAEAKRVVDPTRNTAAYQAYLQGRYLWNQRSEPGLRRAIEHFRRAIELDPSFALAYAALADTYTTLGYLSWDAPVATFPVARPYALKAMELDPSLSQAHASLAYIKFYFDWDWAGAGEEFRRAIELNPNEPVAHQWHARYLLAAGRPDDAMDEIRTAQRLDPLSLAINTDVGLHHYYSGRHAEAIAQLQSVLGMKSDFGLAYLWLARAYLAVGRPDESLAAAKTAEATAPQWIVFVAQRGYTLGAMGRADEARAVLDEMARLSTQRFVTAYGVALVYAGLGDKEQAFAWLEKAFAERSHWLMWLRLDPRWKALRSDPRFAGLVARMKYPG
jgi:DNA-binding winged helix-turn-helix (wHTH) protein/tetratricopeptide (TPR) repeat protein